MNSSKEKNPIIWLTIIICIYSSVAFLRLGTLNSPQTVWETEDIGTEIILDVPPKIVDERTLVPARAVAESFDAFVDWDGATKTVIIKTEKEDDLYGAASPVLDFSQDDGTMSRLHCQLRLTFEQSYLPEMIFTNQEELKKVIVESPKDFLGYIDDAVWGPCMNSVIVDYMINSEEEYVILRLEEEDGETILVTIDDDDEFEAVADIFDDQVFGDIDYDDGEEDEE